MPSRRGRPPSFDRAEVLDKLLFLFWEKGYEATSQADMVERTGIASSSLYNTFGNKPDVFDAVMARYNEISFGLLTPLREGTEGLADIEAFLTGIALYIREPQGPPGCLMVRTMTELGGRADAPPTAERTCLYRDQITVALRGALGRAAELREFAPDSLEAKASLILSVYLGALATSISSPETGAQMIENGRAMVKAWRGN